MRVVIVRVILDGVLGVMIVVLIGHNEVLVIYVAILIVTFCNWRCTLYRKCGAIHHSPHPAIQVAESFIGRVAVLPAACPIALDLMKQSQVSIEHS